MAVMHGLLIRIFRVAGITVPNQLAAAAGVAVGFVPMGIATWFAHLGGFVKPADLAITAGYSFSVYVVLGYCYFHLFNMSETARRVRILYEINRRKRLTGAELSGIYGAGQMLENRIERLVSTGQIKKSGERYMISSRWLYNAARLFAIWGRILNLPIYVKR